MAGQVRVEEVTRQEHKQDCGCGCGGDLCGAARQEVILVGFPRPAASKETRADRSDRGCGCGGRS